MQTKKRLLIVDDDEAILESLEDILFKKYNVKTANNGKEALEILNEDKNFNLLILDIMMPDMDGFQLAAEINNKNIEIPFIFLSAKVNIEDKVQGFELGADDYIIKPFEKDELLLRLERKLLSEDKIKIRNKRLSLINHNIFNPINSASGFIQILENKLRTQKEVFLSAKIEKNVLIPENEVIHFFNSALDSTMHISESLDQLIKMTRNLSEIFNPLDMQIFKNKTSIKLLIYDALVLSKPKNLQCEVINSIPDIEIEIDKDKIIKVFYEILDNATLHNDEKEKKAIIQVDSENDTVIFTVSDNGRGIHQENREQIFNEFWSAAETINHTRGEGLGLWICKKYIDAHNGKIWIEDSEETKGTTIKFGIPILK